MHGAEREVYFAQEHPPGRLGLSDFSVADELEVLIAGQAFPPRIWQFALALWLAKRPELPIVATVVFYGARNGDFAFGRSSFLLHFAGNDKWVSAASVKKLQRCLERSGRPDHGRSYPAAGHWIFESDRADAYQPEAAALAWQRTLVCLADCGLAPAVGAGTGLPAGLAPAACPRPAGRAAKAAQARRAAATSSAAPRRRWRTAARPSTAPAGARRQR